jgi:hypothetical protein
MAMSRVRLTIDHLALKGFDAVDGRALVDALRRELVRILSDPAARAELNQSRHTPVVRLGTVPIENGVTGSRNFGAAVGRAIARRLKP